MFALTGKTILVTGASKGIGAAIVGALGEAGANVVAHYGSDRAGAEEATRSVPPERRHVLGAELNLPGEAERLWGEALAWRGRIDVLVNNAAVMRIGGGIEDEDAAWEAVWAEAIQVNVLAPAKLMRQAVRHYLEADGGIIISISSWAAQRGPTNPALLAYVASKGALLSATKAIARNYANRNILAYSVTPGVVRTRLSEQTAAAAGGEAAFTAQLAMGEWVPPSDIANLVTFLASGACRHLTGATLDVNGASYIR